MHVNPYFSQVDSRSNYDQSLNPTKRRIFVNPNFIRPNNFVNNSKSYAPSLYYETPLLKQNDIENSSTNFNEHIVSYQNIHENLETKLSPAVTKSRYTLVRKNDKCTANVETIRTTSTVKISKYKTMQLSLIKNNIEQQPKKPEVKLQTTQYRNQSLSKYNYITKSTYQSSSVNRTYIKINKQTPTVRKSIEVKTSIKIPKAKKTLFSPNVSINRKTIARKYKKNNIPCPLFTKYGKCLRNIQGNCEFLHDKKHVSICRKFLKGICHDPACLLSHELSAKKMPTCYFYLNGNCTKINCPYLHVKLNNKTKLCNDFLKGYCENGDRCIYRHVNKEVKTAIKQNMNRQRRFTCSTPIVMPKKIKIKPVLKKPAERYKSVSETERDQDEDVNCRYFKNDTQEDEQNQTCDVIKPSRCKLGTLPSFIKL
ncbi:Zinc finger CCCH domain-containing protein 3 [Papilio machaon]|uniref:Zinc finger CCCH domain-containing protein 3 n=1 Tax=Papilio machaon TaxID=76193 RepID=A0A194QNS6_PAPMA|nr:Zinc finger CCCH domain-containing protein 3 [Papilio machaon]